MKVFFVLFFLILNSFSSAAQKNITKSIKDFGAKGDGHSDDQDAFVKASIFFNERKGNGKLVIPKGIYIVGRQTFSGNGQKNISIAYLGDNVLDLKECQNLTIEANPGAVLKHRDSLRIGTFSPATGEAFKHNIKNIQEKPEYLKYVSNAGNMIFIFNCSNIRITGLKLNGNTPGFKFGGNWGSGHNAYELIHYGINIKDSRDVTIINCSIENFACDGIYITNTGQELKTCKISIDKCKVNYCGRNGLSWLGGKNISVTNAEFSNMGQGVVQESPSAGIDIEVENNSFCRNGYFYNCKMENNVGSGIASGSKELSSDVLFKKCIAASPVYYSVFVDAASHRFEDCSFYGTVLVWYNATNKNDAVQFRRCFFDENYKGKTMYDGTYQLGAEASGVTIDSCTFKAYTTSSYYLAGHAKDCDPNNIQMNHVSNSSFYNYCRSGFKLSEKTAGAAGHTIFYNNRFYSHPNIIFRNGFDGKCNADGGKNQFFQVAGH